MEFSTMRQWVKGVKRSAASLFLLMGIAFEAQAIASNSETEEQQIKIFIARMVKDHHFDRHWLESLFVDYTPDPAVLASINHPYEQKPWTTYRKTFLTPERIQQGVAYWKKHQSTLAFAEQRYGIDPSVIIAIIGVESLYGRQVGQFEVLNALATLTFDYPKRAHYFGHELEQFLLLSSEQGLNPTQILGSYAGAIGLPQFMPSSYRRFAISYHNKQGANLVNNDDDAIVSTANYLNNAGWIFNDPVTVQIQMTPDNHTQWSDSLKTSNIQLTNNFRQLASKDFDQAPNAPRLASLVALQMQNEKEYWLTFHNFSVIMRYNPRIQYAMAVFQLSDAIKKRWLQEMSHQRLWNEKETLTT